RRPQRRQRVLAERDERVTAGEDGGGRAAAAVHGTGSGDMRREPLATSRHEGGGRRGDRARRRTLPPPLHTATRHAILRGRAAAQSTAAGPRRQAPAASPRTRTLAASRECHTP